MSLKSYTEWREAHKAQHFLEEVQDILDEEREEDESWEQPSLEEKNETPSYDLTEEGWCEIKGIGPKLAKRLVENGPFTCIEEISKIKGINKGVLDCIQQFLFSSPTPEKMEAPVQTDELPEDTE